MNRHWGSVVQAYPDGTFPVSQLQSCLRLMSFSSPDFSKRVRATEWMDDRSVADDYLQETLANLRWINRWLGGYRATRSVLAPLLRCRESLRVLDLGTGAGDYLAAIVWTGHATGTAVQATGVDLNPVAVGHGRAWLDTTLPRPLRSQVQLMVGDALALPYADNTFDVVHAALFLHHFYDKRAVALLREMRRVSRLGILVNDLHRHPLAYAGIWLLTRGLSFSPMVQHDAPLSVRRGFSRSELRALACRAGASRPRVRWHWAFRWTLSTLSPCDR